MQARQVAGDGEIRNHEREGLLLAEFARAQSLDGRGIAGVAGEVVAAQSLDGENLPGTKQFGGFANGRLAGKVGTVFLAQEKRGAAIRAGDRLCMEAPVRRIVILGTAIAIERSEER